MSVDVPSELERHLPFEVLFNFRDLGGYAADGGRHTRWRALFRADGVHRLTGPELAPLGIRTVLDLRTPGELEERGQFTHDGVTTHHLPVLQATWEGAGIVVEDHGGAGRFLADRYLEMLDVGAEAIGTALRLVADAESLPLVFHCAAGKDRTGVVAALTLSLLGVTDDVIVADYALSQKATKQFTAWLKETFPDRLADIEAQPTALLDSPAEAMRLFLADLRSQRGSVEAYCRSVGVDAAVVEALRANLLA